MNVHSLQDLVAIARSGSPFYAALYERVPLRGFSLEDLPIATFEEVMRAVHGDHRAMLSSEAAYGMCYTTSGTTGRPKATMFGRDEWRTVSEVLAATHWKNGLLVDGDVVCNLSEPGSASFMAIHRVVDTFPGRCSEIPIGCDTPYENVVRVMRLFGANVIAGMSPTLLGLAESLLRTEGPDLRVERLLGGGELFYGAQLEMLREAFPKARFCPFMYGATEAGMIGYSDLSMDHNVFRAFDGLCRVEIVDPITREPIREAGRLGRILVTSFVRLAAPAIRLETGDLAKWVDDPAGPGPRFSLHGRMFPFARELAGITVNEDQVWRLVCALEPALRLSRLQLVLQGTRSEPKIEVVLSLHRQEIADGELGARITEAIATTMPELWSAVAAGLALRVRRVAFAHFEPMSRRKSRLIADERT